MAVLPPESGKSMNQEFWKDNKIRTRRRTRFPFGIQLLQKKLFFEKSEKKMTRFPERIQFLLKKIFVNIFWKKSWILYRNF